MASQQSGEVKNDSVYTASQLAAIINVSERQIKQFIREHVKYRIVCGKVVVSGFLWRMAIESESYGSDENEDDTRASNGDE